MTEKNSEQPSNAYEADKPGTAARSLAEVRIEELRTTGGLFVEAVRATRMPMAVTDPSLPGNPIVFANAAFLDLSGYGMDEVLGQQPFFMNGEETDEEDAVRFRKALEEDRDEVIETVQYRKDGSRFVASLFLSAFKDEEGRTVNQFLSYLDVTRRVAAEHELVSRAKIEARLRESEARHRLLVESFAQAVWEADADGVVVADSPSWRSYTGQSLDEWLGYGWLDAIHPDDRAYAERQWRYAVAAGALVNVEFRVRAPDGGWRWTNVRAAPVLDAQGRIEKWAGMNINIDARRRAETDEQQVEQVALKMLADQLLVDRAYITTSDYGKGETEVPVEVRRGELPPLVGIFRHADSPESAQQVNEGTLVVEDVETDTSLSELNRRSFAAVQIKALIGVGLRKGVSDIFWTLAVATTEPRNWSSNEVLLMKEAAERTWAALERAPRGGGAARERSAAPRRPVRWPHGNLALGPRCRRVRGRRAIHGTVGFSAHRCAAPAHRLHRPHDPGRRGGNGGDRQPGGRSGRGVRRGA
jgi:PAS domain S-box-containing protein